MEITFVKIVQQYFQFLLNNFGFTLTSATESPRGDLWEGNVQYVSKTTYVELNCSRAEDPSLWIGRAKDEKDYLMPMQVIYEYMTLTDDEKKVVLSVPHGRQAANILSKKQLLNQAPNIVDADERKRFQVDVYAKSLHQYGLPFLRGSFSQWLSIWEYHLSKLTVENARAGYPEFVPIVITDENGQFKVIGKEHVFKKILDYIKKLKDE